MYNTLYPIDWQTKEYLKVAMLPFTVNCSSLYIIIGITIFTYPIFLEYPVPEGISSWCEVKPFGWISGDSKSGDELLSSGGGWIQSVGWEGRGYDGESWQLFSGGGGGGAEGMGGPAGPVLDDAAFGIFWLSRLTIFGSEIAYNKKYILSMQKNNYARWTILWLAIKVGTVSRYLSRKDQIT